ncbi:hypothetical protein chiPu_0019260, partial [Chiloscyllium punctatum]|nr:hypothetical protein [Chiloscyllium punctatum]
MRQPAECLSWIAFEVKTAFLGSFKVLVSKSEGDWL